MPVQPKVRTRARVVGALIAMAGLVVLHQSVDRFVDAGVSVTAFRFGVLAIILASCVILVGLILHDLGRTGWALPAVQLGAVVVVLAVLPLLFAAFIAVRAEMELAPVLFFCGLAASLAIFLMVLAGQTKGDADRARRLNRLARR